MTDADRVIFSPFSALQSHRDERACRYHSSICASRERAGVRAAAAAASAQGGGHRSRGKRSSCRERRMERTATACISASLLPPQQPALITVGGLPPPSTFDLFSTQRADRGYLRCGPQVLCDWWNEEKQVGFSFLCTMTSFVLSLL
ncbi:hypothetical protein INR49_026187 [Caranx melampygus]|nr:hypothetical protein INR49_026187 [Caranx melampygus]